ncbi:MAG: glycerol kinase GlpK [Chloroflexota bacterium]
MSGSHILALDQGTTGSGAIVFDAEARIVASADTETRQIYPRPGWVSHDASEIFETTLQVAARAMADAGLGPSDLASIGITNQRETTVVWDRHTGQPVGDAIVWQCRRTAPICRELTERGLGPLVHERTGLVIDAYFSGTKIRWLLDSIPDGQARAERGDLLAGTIDAWLIWKLTGGGVHATDVSNASRTMLFDIHRRRWDPDLLAALDVPVAMLPRVVESSGIVGEVAGEAARALGGVAIPIAGIAGDQQSALFGQACFTPGSAKNTYGTGSFTLMNTGAEPRDSRQGLLTTLAWSIGGQVEYALEGGVFVTGSAVQWLRDGLGIIASAAESEALAASVPDTGDVYFVPAFAGLGAPHWDMAARGTMVGLTGGTTRAHIVRATLESIAFQTAEVLDTMQRESGLEIPVLRVDGGGSANGFLMQFQADILGAPIDVAAVQETTAQGAAFLAGIASGLWRDRGEVQSRWRLARTFEPRMSADERSARRQRWSEAVKRSRGWAHA